MVFVAVFSISELQHQPVGIWFAYHKTKRQTFWWTRNRDDHPFIGSDGLVSTYSVDAAAAEGGGDVCRC